MLDVIGGISLTFVAAALVATLSLAAFRERLAGVRAAAAAAIWFVAVVALAGLGVYSRLSGVGLPAFALTLVLPLIAGVVAGARSSTARNLMHAAPMPVLVGVHAGRVLGVLFLLLLAANRLPPTFARSAGLGDILVGVAALPVAWVVARHARGWRWMAAIWNAFGLVDLITAVSLGIGSIAGSPLRFVFEPTSSSAVTTLPWALIPGFLVPIYLFTHLVIFAQLAHTAHAHDHAPRGALREVPAR